MNVLVWAREGTLARAHADGYATYRMHGHRPTVARVDDLTATTTDAHIALWRALLGLDLRDKVIYGTHPADPLPPVALEEKFEDCAFGVLERPDIRQVIEFVQRLEQLDNIGALMEVLTA